MTHIESHPHTPHHSTQSIFDRVRHAANLRRILRAGTIGATLLSPLSLSRETLHYTIPDFHGPPAYVAGRTGDTTYDTELGEDIICFPQDSREIDSLENLFFQPSDFVDIGTNSHSANGQLFEPNGEPIRPKNTHVLLMQVDTEESGTCKIDYFSHMFAQAFEQLPLTISYLKKPVPIPFARANERVVTGLEETETVMNAISKSTGRHYSKVLVFLNSDAFIGITSYRPEHDIAFMTLNNPESLYIALHEGGHFFGLDDGYKHNLSFEAAITSSELTFGHEYTKDEARVAIDPNMLGELIPTGTVINGKQIFFRQDPGFKDFNIMRYANTEGINARLKAQKPVFSPYQVRYMQEHLKRNPSH